jgi:Protein of unknown function (DUF3108)
MKIKSFTFITVLFLGFSMRSGSGFSDEFCGIQNTSFASGEKITYTVFYNVAGLYVNSGNASFSNTLEKMGGKTVYHVVGEGATNSSYDWIYKVRDKYESYIDTGTLQPLKFVRNIQEGGFKKYENISFSRNTNTAVTSGGVYKVPDCVQDVLSAIYYARNINFDKYKPGDKIPFSMFLDNEVYDMYIRYMGKEQVKTKFGKFKAIKFKPLLIQGTIFKGGEKMTVWVTDDPNHIPVRVESPIVVGTIKADMMDYENLRYPLTSLVRKK